MNRLIINFKTYKQGRDVLKLVKKIDKIDKNIIVGLQASDIYNVFKNTKLRIYAQHVDYFRTGRNTGFILPEAVKANGAEGTFLNHSEHRLKFDDLKKTVKRCREINLKTLVFVSGLKGAKLMERLKPTYIVVEPPELVAGNKSVSKYKSGLIKSISKKLKSDFIVGAGIHSKEDVELALKFGAKGVVVSSSVTKTKKPEKIIKEFLGVLK